MTIVAFFVPHIIHHLILYQLFSLEVKEVPDCHTVTTSNYLRKKAEHQKE